MSFTPGELSGTCKYQLIRAFAGASHISDTWLMRLQSAGNDLKGGRSCRVGFFSPFFLKLTPEKFNSVTLLARSDTCDSVQSKVATKNRGYVKDKRCLMVLTR